MRKKNLIVGALFSIVLLVGVAWYGERTHGVRPPPPTRTTTVLGDPPLPVTPEPPPVDGTKDDSPPSRKTDDIAPPMQPEPVPPKPIPGAIVQPPDPLRPGDIPRGIDRVPPFSTGSGNGTGVFDPSQLEQQPVAKYQARADYPYSMKQNALSGEVLVDFIVDTSGDVRNVTVARSTEHGFDDAACRAVGRWKFRPGRKGGHAVFVHMQVPIVFSLSPENAR